MVRILTGTGLDSDLMGYEQEYAGQVMEPNLGPGVSHRDPYGAGPPAQSSLGALGGLLGLGAGAAAAPAAASAVPIALGAVGAAVPALAGVAGAGAALFGIAQALGFGEGEGIFGLDVLGGDEQYRSGIPFGGPGLAEPPAQWVEKEWHVSYDWGRLQYYLVRMPSGLRKIALYNTRTKKWKIWTWRTPRLAVIGKNMPSHKMITRLRRNLKKHSADARTILKMTNPTALRAPKRRR